VGPRTGLDTVDRERSLAPFGESDSGLPTHNPSLYRLSYPGSESSLIYSHGDLHTHGNN
jgi:hypothetical protein